MTYMSHGSFKNASRWFADCPYLIGSNLNWRCSKDTHFVPQPTECHPHQKCRLPRRCALSRRGPNIRRKKTTRETRNARTRVPSFQDKLRVTMQTFWRNDTIRLSRRRPSWGRTTPNIPRITRISSEWYESWERSWPIKSLPLLWRSLVVAAEVRLWHCIELVEWVYVLFVKGLLV